MAPYVGKVFKLNILIWCTSIMIKDLDYIQLNLTDLRAVVKLYKQDWRLGF